VRRFLIASRKGADGDMVLVDVLKWCDGTCACACTCWELGIWREIGRGKELFI
jgi:hypothetical protein